jgi:hypothetical protein
MEKIINYTLDLGGISPCEPNCIGYQGEHRATAVVFTPANGLLEKISEQEAKGSKFSVSVEFITEAGEIFSSDEADVSAISEPFFISGDMSEAGLDSKIIVKITETDMNGEISEFLRATAQVYFLSGRGYGREFDKNREVDLIKEKTAAALSLIEGKCAEAEGIVSDGVSRVQKIQQTSADQLKKTLAAAENTERLANETKEAAEQASVNAALSEAEAEKAKEFSLSAVNQVKGYLDAAFGDSGAALDVIIALQEEYMRGGDR